MRGQTIGSHAGICVSQGVHKQPRKGSELWDDDIGVASRSAECEDLQEYLSD